MSHSVVTNSTLCIGYHTYEAVCSETHRQRGLQSMPRLKVMLNEKESAPQLYHHCEDVPRAVVCPVNAITRADGAVQLNESLCVDCKLYDIACLFSAIELSDNHPLDTPADASAPKAPPAPPAPARVSTSLDWVSGTRAIIIKCSLCNFDEQGSACVRICPTRALHLVDNADIIRVGKHKCELAFDTGFGDLTLFQQTQSGKTR